MKQQWTIAGYTVTIEPGDYQGQPGFDYFIHAADETYSAGGWEPSEAGALRSSLTRLERLTASAD